MNGKHLPAVRPDRAISSDGTVRARKREWLDKRDVIEGRCRDLTRGEREYVAWLRSRDAGSPENGPEAA